MSKAPYSLDDRRVQDMISRREFAGAESLIRENLKRNPENPDSYYFLGVLHYFQNQVGQAVENLRRSLSIDPHHTDSAICLSVLFNDIGKYDEAKKVFDQANQSVAHPHLTATQEVDKKFAVKHLELADLYFRYRRYDEAIEEYGKAANLDVTALDIRIRKAKAYAKKGFITRSLQELQQLKHEHPNFIPARIQLGLLHYSQGNILDAELEWEAGAEIEPTNREIVAYLDMAKQARTKS